MKVFRKVLAAFRNWPVWPFKAELPGNQHHRESDIRQPELHTSSEYPLPQTQFQVLAAGGTPRDHGCYKAAAGKLPSTDANDVCSELLVTGN